MATDKNGAASTVTEQAKGEPEVEKKAWTPAQRIVLLLRCPVHPSARIETPTQPRRSSTSLLKRYTFTFRLGKKLPYFPPSPKEPPSAQSHGTTDTAKSNQTSRRFAGGSVFYNLYFLAPSAGSAILNIIRSGAVLQKLRGREAS